MSRRDAIQKERQERLAHANALIKIISDHGRRFFYHQGSGRVAHLELERGRVWLIDDYTQKRVNTGMGFGGYSHGWRGFSHGGTLRQLVEMMRDYVLRGWQISPAWIGIERLNSDDGNIWGYQAEAMATVRREAGRLPIIASPFDPLAKHDIETADGARGYIASYFRTELRNHHYDRYIKERLAGDFACVLARHLATPTNAAPDARSEKP